MSQIQYLQGRPLRPGEDDAPHTSTSENDSSPSNPLQQQWDIWRSQRRAILHTVDVSPKFSAHAEKIVRGFRRGLYAGNVDFYVGHVENWIADQIQRRTPKPLLPLTLTSRTVEPFLTHAILDMPAANQRIPHVAPILKKDGILAVFMPSITQIGECVDLIRRQDLPFVMDKVVELGPGLSSGRQWDVRFAVKKSRADPSSWMETVDAGDSAVQPDLDSLAEDKNMGDIASAPAEEETSRDYKDSVLVCRPKVGNRIVGGGFVGIWRRIEGTRKR
ncbi:hypothetical protein EYZ11_001474 [Aspergillus tanneri]|nr:hypothetical protein EYZ11_001474 [Aspergillus tanneri]